MSNKHKKKKNTKNSIKDGTLDTIKAIISAKNITDLHGPLQVAIELEHATIPPYLTAQFSLKPIPPFADKLTDEDQRRKKVWQVIHSVVIEEMMHMTIAANILNALGGAPSINKKKFVPDYPTKLPMHIDEKLKVHLKKFSRQHVKHTFMSIEEPEPYEHPTYTELREQYAKNPDMKFDDYIITIGLFYHLLQGAINYLAPDWLPGDPKKQVTSKFYGRNDLFPILTKKDALDAIDIIVEQGEGTEKTGVLDEDGELAHYYRFKELYKGRAVRRGDCGDVITQENGEPIFDGASLILDGQKSIWNISFAETTKVLSEEWNINVANNRGEFLLREFNTLYNSLLFGLHNVFNNQSITLDETIGVMFDLSLIAQRLCATPIPGVVNDDGPVHWAPTFQFQKSRLK